MRRVLRGCILAVACRGPFPALTNLLILIVLSAVVWLAIWLAGSAALGLLVRDTDFPA